MSPLYFSINPHSISIHSHFHASSLTLSILWHSSLPSFLHFLFLPIRFFISLSPLIIFTLITFHHYHTSHHHSHSFLSHSIHLFILIIFHAFSHHRICITLITSHIHLSFIPHHPHSILLPFHHSRIFHFSTHPFHHGALRDYLKTHFHPFHLAYPRIHYSNLLSFLFQLHHLHHHTSLLFILIRIHVLYSFISIHFHHILPLNHFHHTHSYTFPFKYSHSIPFHHYHSFPIPLLTPHSHMFSGIIALHYPPLSFISSNPILISLFHSSLFFATYLRFSTMISNPCLFG